MRTLRARKRKWDLQPQVLLCFALAFVNSDVRNHAGATPLFIAAANGHGEVVYALCCSRDEEDLEVTHLNNVAEGHNKATPLFIAAQNGNSAVVRLLLMLGAEAKPVMVSQSQLRNWSTAAVSGLLPANVASRATQIAAIAFVVLLASASFPKYAPPLLISAAQKSQRRTNGRARCLYSVWLWSTNRRPHTPLLATSFGHPGARAVLLSTLLQIAVTPHQCPAPASHESRRA